MVAGVFIQGKMPEQPSAMPESDGDEQALEVEHVPGDFCFLYVGNQLNHFIVSDDLKVKTVEIFFTVETFVLAYAQAFLVMSTDQALEQEFDFEPQYVEQVTIHGADFNQSPHTTPNPGELPTNKYTEVFSLDLAANEQPKDKVADEAEADS